MVNTRQIRSWLRIVLCALLCIGATLDDIDYINAIRAPRTMNGLRSSSVADDDSDDQHAHLMTAPTAAMVELNAPFLSDLHAVHTPAAQAMIVACTVIRAGRAPPAFVA